MTTTMTIRQVLRQDPYCAANLARAQTWRTASRWGVPDSVHPYTRDSFRSLMRCCAKRAVNEAKYRIALQTGGAL